MKDSFLIYKSFYKPISRLSDKQLGRLFRAIFKYQLSEEVTVEEDIEMAFEFFKNQFEIDELKYQGIVERNRNNGRKGGNDKNSETVKTKPPLARLAPTGLFGVEWLVWLPLGLVLTVHEFGCHIVYGDKTEEGIMIIEKYDTKRE